MQTGFTADLLAPVLAGIVSTLATFVLCRTRSLPLDQPNERSLHKIPLPRTGGIAIIAGVAAAAMVLEGILFLILPAGLLAVVSYVDDRHPLPAPVRLAFHLFAAALFLWVGGPLSVWALTALVVAVAWLTNLYNFMDGSDGLAGGMAVIGFGSLAIVAVMSGAFPLGLLSLAIGTAAGGFLIFNFPPARIFMGDVGSIPLGFLAGAIGVAGWQQSVWPLWLPLLVFSPFVIDATVTLVRRILQGERIWQAHRQHYYQRLILAGWSHRKTAMVEYALMIFAGGSAIACVASPGLVGPVMLTAYASAVLMAMWTVDRRWARFAGTSR